MPITQVISTLPPGPDLSTDTPQVFSQKAVAVVQAQVVAIPQINIWTGQANALAGVINADADTAADAAGTATQRAADALASATTAEQWAVTAAQSTNATKWVSGTTYPQGAAVWSPANFRTYRRKIAGAGTNDPLLDGANWGELAILPFIIRKPRSSNTLISTADSGALIDITGGSFTQTFAACSVLGSGWFVYYRNSGSSDITLDPNGSELIDGVASGVIRPGMTLLIQCDGSALNVLRIDSSIITEIKTSGSAGTFPLGVRRARLRLAGGGSSGCAKGSGGTATPNGSAGGYLEASIAITNPAYIYTIGAGGAGVATSSTTTAALGNAGGNTTFNYVGTTYIAGGAPAITSAFSSSPGGIATGGDINVPGEPGEYYGGNRVDGGFAGRGQIGFGSGGLQVVSTGTPSESGLSGAIILEY